MRVDIPDAAAEQPRASDENENFIVGGDHRLRQLTQRAEHDIALPQIAKCEFANDERVPEHRCAIQQSFENDVAGAQMIDPDGSIDQGSPGLGPSPRYRFYVGLATAAPRQPAR